MLKSSWKSEPLGRVATLQRGFDLPHRQRKPGTVPVVTSSGLGDTHNESRVAGPGVVTGRYGTIGQVFFVRPDFWPLNTTLYVRDFHDNDPLFVSYLLRTIDFHTHSGKSGVPGVNRNDLHEIVVRLPSTKAEQEAIARALSNADAVIESLAQLIAKKRHIKQGAMQELLTGKRRLSGFSGEWDVKQLAELGTWKGGMTPSMQNPSYWDGGTVLWISSGDVKSLLLTETASLITDVAVKQGKTTLLPPKSIVIVTRSGILRKYLPVAMNVVGMAINQDIKALIPSDQFDALYLLHLLIGNGDQILATCLKAGTTVESVEFSWLKGFAAPVPKIEEQIAIAAILSDMDAEIAALESKVAKARQIKQGMMQNLLTGRVRLV